METVRISLQSEMPSENLMRNLFVQFHSCSVDLQIDFAEAYVYVSFNNKTGLRFFQAVHDAEPWYELR